MKDNYDTKVAKLIDKITVLVKRTDDEDAIEVLIEAVACITTTATFLECALGALTPEQRDQITKRAREALKPLGVGREEK